MAKEQAESLLSGYDGFTRLSKQEWSQKERERRLFQPLLKKYLAMKNSRDQ